MKRVILGLSLGLLLCSIDGMASDQGPAAAVEDATKPSGGAGGRPVSSEAEKIAADWLANRERLRLLAIDSAGPDGKTFAEYDSPAATALELEQTALEQRGLVGPAIEKLLAVASRDEVVKGFETQEVNLLIEYKAHLRSGVLTRICTEQEAKENFERQKKKSDAQLKLVREWAAGHRTQG